MITVIHPGTPYTSFGISNIIKAILDNPDSLLTMVRVTKTTEEKDGTRDYSWAAVFREPGTIGQIVALVNQWGTSFGPSAGGTSSALYGEMMSCIEDNGLPLSNVEWMEIDSELRDKLERYDLYECYQAWEQLVIQHVFRNLHSLLPHVDYPINDKWYRLRKRALG